MTRGTNRRAVLGAVLAASAAAAAALPAVAIAGVACSPHPDAELFAAIERHRAAFAAFVDTCGPTDTVLAAQQGREVTQADEDACDDALAAEKDALSELKATAPLTLAGQNSEAVTGACAGERAAFGPPFSCGTTTEVQTERQSN